MATKSNRSQHTRETKDGKICSGMADKKMKEGMSKVSNSMMNNTQGHMKVNKQ